MFGYCFLYLHRQIIYADGISRYNKRHFSCPQQKETNQYRTEWRYGNASKV